MQVSTAVATSKSTPHYLFTDSTVVLPVQFEDVPTHMHLETIDLNTADKLWTSSAMKVMHPPLLGQLNGNIIVAAYYTELELFNPPQIEARAKCTVNARSNNMPLFLQTAGSCIYTMMSVVSNETARSKQPPFGGCWFALLETIVRTDAVWSLSSQIVLHTASAGLDLVAADTDYGPVCAVVVHEQAVSVHVYFSQEKRSRQVIVPSLCGEHVVPSLLLHRNSLFLSCFGKVLAYDLGSLAAPVREIEIFPQRSSDLESLSNMDKCCVTMQLDVDRLLCMSVRQNSFVALHAIDIEGWAHKSCSFTCRSNEFPFQWFAEQSNGDLRCHFTDSAVFLFNGVDVVRLRHMATPTDDKPDRTHAVGGLVRLV